MSIAITNKHEVYLNRKGAMNIRLGRLHHRPGYPTEEGRKPYIYFVGGLALTAEELEAISAHLREMERVEYLRQQKEAQS